MTLKITRRRFVDFGSTTFLINGLSFAVPRTRSFAMGGGRRFLINLQSFGGVDPAWSYSPMLEKDSNTLSIKDRNRHFYGVYTTAPRFPDELAKPMANGFLGITMSTFTSADLSQIALIRGMRKDGDHDVGNRMIQNGHLSGYAASFSAIVADALAKVPDNLRPLHYVQLTQSPSDFRSQVGFFTGHAVPINIANSSVWNQLSAIDPKDPASSDELRNLLNQSLESLAHVTGDRLEKSSSAKLFKEDFTGAYNSANAILGKNFSQNPDFLAAVDRYRSAILNDFRSLIFGSSTGPYIKEALKNHPSMKTVSEANLLNSLNSEFNTLDAMIFPFALAEFLITKDLSAVVDVPVAGGDFHDFNDRDMLRGAANLICLKTLLNRLQSLPGKGVLNGDSLLDQTLVIYSTEFDREVARTVQNSANSSRPGTNHGVTASAILAGHRVKGNKIIGGRATGSGGSFGALNQPFLAPLPINIQTGEPNMNGQIISQLSILPTVLEIFGISVPSQQKTEMTSISAVIKS